MIKGGIDNIHLATEHVHYKQYEWWHCLQKQFCLVVIRHLKKEIIVVMKVIEGHYHYYFPWNKNILSHNDNIAMLDHSYHGRKYQILKEFSYSSTKVVQNQISKLELTMIRPDVICIQTICKVSFWQKEILELYL